MKKLYTTSVTATGGRNGKVKSENGILDFEVQSPKALGGKSDDFTNPEMLFAAGYASCFGSALSLAIDMSQKKTGETSVEAQVTLGKKEDGHFGLAVDLLVNIPGVSPEEAQTLAERAHEICPYSISTRNNIAVTLEVTNN